MAGTPATNEGPSFVPAGPAARRKVTISTGSLVSTTPPAGGATVPLTVEPERSDVDLAGWLSGSRETVESWLHRHGAVLFRGFRVEGAPAFFTVAQSLASALETYQERAAPRHEVHDRVYTSTEYPASERIPLHHEMSYADRWPMRLWFHCAQPSVSGGCTPLVDDRLLLARIPDSITRPFLEKGIMYVRNFGQGADLSWQDAFQTTERAEVERYCHAHRIAFQWRPGDRLRTRQVRRPLATHPVTGDVVWFNHAHMFHLSNLTPQVRASLTSEFRDDELPRNAFYGDGTRIDDEVLESIRNLYWDSAVRFPWRIGDVLLVDNILVSHGRDTFTGGRKILVAMTDMS